MDKIPPKNNPPTKKNRPSATKRLTIAIPTYNRTEALARTIRSLLPQLTTEVGVVVLDNHSPIPVENFLAQTIGKEHLRQVRVIRHQANVGGVANILRCIEIGDTEWVWTLGDDDLPAPDATKTILHFIQENPDADFISFSSNINPGRNPFTAENLGAFLERCDSIGNTFFISTAVYRREVFAEYLISAVNYTYTTIPQLTLLIFALLANKRALFPSQRIVTWQMPTTEPQWPYFFFYQFSETIELVPTFSAQKKLLQLFSAGEKTSPANLIRWALLSQLNNPQSPSALFFVSRAAWIRSQFADGMLLRCRWRVLSSFAMLLHRNADHIFKFWSIWHRFRHGTILKRQQSQHDFRGLVFHR